MNFLQIFNQIEEQVPEIYGRLDTRRDAMRSFAGLGKKLALTSLPFALGSMFNKAYGQTPTGVIGVLNFALTLDTWRRNSYTPARWHRELTRLVRLGRRSQPPSATMKMPTLPF